MHNTMDVVQAEGITLNRGVNHEFIRMLVVSHASSTFLCIPSFSIFELVTWTVALHQLDKFIRKMGPPECVGEIALVKDSCQRTATVMSDDKETMVLVLRREDLAKAEGEDWLVGTKRKLLEKANSRLTSTLKEIPFLDDVPDDKLETMSSMFSVITASDGTTLCRTGAVGSAFYILTQGRVDVIKEVRGAVCECVT